MKFVFLYTENYKYNKFFLKILIILKESSDNELQSNH